MSNNQIENSYESELSRQEQFILSVRKMNDEKADANGKKQLMYIKTYGCQMNERDSEKIAGILKSMGFETAKTEKEADFVIYNTCCIRENAENKVFGNLGRLKYYKDRNPDLRIALCGCMVQQENIIELIKEKYKYIDMLFGTFNFHRLPELMHTNMVTNKPVIDIWQEHTEIVEDLPASRRYKWKAGVNIMYGCDNYCAYCIVPYVRGRERSRRTSDILDEIKRLAGDGVKEVLLLGQNVNSYGKKLDESTTFAQLLQKINEVDDLRRIRFMTPHPKDFSDELIDVIAKSKSVCKHVHLPMQSGSTRVLKSMNRKYTKEHFLDLAYRIKEKIPDVALTTDIIVGFPGETEEDFSDTLDLVKKIRFQGAFTFIYSKRTGTPAASMEQLAESVVKERFERLLETQNKIVEEINDTYVGKTLAVMADEISRKKGDLIVSGRTDGNVLVHFNGCEKMLGELTEVKITKNRVFFLEGIAE